jgi:hypothetical protein
MLDILEKTYTNPILRRTTVPLFMSSPGQGKSTVIKQFAESKGVNMVKITLSQRMPNEVVGMLMPDLKTGKMVAFNSYELSKVKPGDIVFFDEVFNGTLKQTLDAVLNLLEDRMLPSGKKLADVMIVAASNPQGLINLTPQIKERFVWYTTTFDGPMWSDFMFKKYGLIKPIANKLINLITSEDFTTNNFNTPRSLDKAVDMIINGVPTPYNNVVKPILETLIENKIGKNVKLSETSELVPHEQITWLELIRMKNGIINK